MNGINKVILIGRMLKCEASDQYQMIYPPRCNANSPCDTCVAKWQAAQSERVRVAQTVELPERTKRPSRSDTIPSRDVNTFR